VGAKNTAEHDVDGLFVSWTGWDEMVNSMQNAENLEIFRKK
jgi:hypothetical protein